MRTLLHCHHFTHFLILSTESCPQRDVLLLFFPFQGVKKKKKNFLKIKSIRGRLKIIALVIKANKLYLYRAVGALKLECTQETFQGAYKKCKFLPLPRF